MVIFLMAEGSVGLKINNAPMGLSGEINAI